MVADLFGRSGPNQRAGLLNRLLGAVGPGAMAGLPGARWTAGELDQVSSSYSQHPQVVQALGGLALTIAMQQVTKRR